MDSSQVIDKVQTFVAAERLLHGVTRLVVGFSGGPDSTAALLLMQRLYGPVAAVHLNHGLRPLEATLDEQWCVAFCRSRQIPVTVQRLAVPAHQLPRESMEMAARRLRLAFWGEYFKGEGDVALVLGHHIDDQIENLLLRLMRGSNSSGMTGLRARTVVQGVTIVRPLLCVDRQEILQFLRAEKIADYRVDTTNDDLRYARNRVRKRVIPELLCLAGNKKSICNSLAFLEQDARYIEHSIQERVARWGASVSVAELLDLGPALWSRAFREWIRRNTGDDRPIKGTLVRNLRRCLSESRQPLTTGARFAVNEDWQVRVANQKLNLEPRRAAQFTAAIDWCWRECAVIAIPGMNARLLARLVSADERLSFGDPDVEWFDAKAVPDRLIVRGRRPGDRMAPFGGKELVKVKGLISNAALSAAEKRRLLVIAGPDDEILWIPRVRRANVGRVRPTSAAIVELRYEFPVQVGS